MKILRTNNTNREFVELTGELDAELNERYPHMASEIASILLRLYEQAQGDCNQQIANRCIDIWDLLFENRVGRTIELTKEIEQ